jgi:hypothetical protein
MLFPFGNGLQCTPMSGGARVLHGIPAYQRHAGPLAVARRAEAPRCQQGDDIGNVKKFSK